MGSEEFGCDKGDCMNNSANSSIELVRAVRSLPYAILGGFALGYTADRYFHLTPWCTLAGGMVGVSGGFYRLLRIGKKSN
jgi:F0F1-type ATP synthase assembly protein I